MELDSFLLKNKVLLPDLERKTVEDGILRMAQNPDPHHSDHHVKGLLDELDIFLANEKTIKGKEIDFGVLLSSIAWHDCWKGSFTQTGSIPIFIFRELFDGYGSSRIFKKYAKQHGLPKNFTKKIIYCILKHARWTQVFPQRFENAFIPMNCIEAKILCDTDGLDSWSERRFDNLLNEYLSGKRIFKPEYIAIAKWWFFNCIQNANDSKFIFQYSKEEFKKRKQVYLIKSIKLWNDRFKYIDVSNERSKKYLNIDLNKLNQEVKKLLIETSHN